MSSIVYRAHDADPFREQRAPWETFDPARQIIDRLCELVELVAGEVYDHQHPTDCFCGHGGFWRDGTISGSWRHDDVVLRFIEAAVNDRIEAVHRLRRMLEPTVRNQSTDAEEGSA